MFRASKLNMHLHPASIPLPRLRLALSRRFKSNLLQGSSLQRSARAQLISAGKHQQSSGHLPEEKSPWPRKIFSGIQPTGSVHLGNYLGAVRKWTQLQNSRDDVTVCIVDMHSITMPHNPPVLRENIFTMAATLVACGIDPAKSTLFVQSAVLEHCEFNWILSSMTTTPRLAQLPQFKEKSRLVRDIPLGLYVYPVLQAADIMLYKATHVPVGADQLQHIQLAQHLARTFNGRYGEAFPVCHAIIEEGDASRVLSLRDPSKKMSKSEANPKATINLCDPPELIMEKIKKAVTDFTSDITYDPNLRPGVSNLVNIHAQVTGRSIRSVLEEAKTLDTAKYKERVGDAVIEHLRPIRERIHEQLSKKNELIHMLEIGAEKARIQAQKTMRDVKQRLGLGAYAAVPEPVVVAPLLPERSKMTASQRVAKNVQLPNHNAHSYTHLENRNERSSASGTASPHGSAGEAACTADLKAMAQAQAMVRPPMRRPVVPKQSMRVEKERKATRNNIFSNSSAIGFKSPSKHDVPVAEGKRQHASSFGFAKPEIVDGTEKAGAHRFGQNTNTSAVASIMHKINAAKNQDTLVHSAYYNAFHGSKSGTPSHVIKNRSMERSIEKSTNDAKTNTCNECSNSEKNSSENPSSEYSNSEQDEISNASSTTADSEDPEMFDELEQEDEVPERSASEAAGKAEIGN
ncbi:tryptophan--tRNA ligase, mitochondrial [Drosophila pseudoobscura]|uniref:tryptophan--tRNA ligase n=1 Tax=Drosophila pseudoobscura pseudoobscura TaxID=46245 RepID=Q2LZ15_DROPS|nr:tryptophan--tRNA ligase, mitochondrial [Drosophila pseudoobscura]